jgi:hypothetical protein
MSLTFTTFILHEFTYSACLTKYKTGKGKFVLAL